MRPNLGMPRAYTNISLGWKTYQGIKLVLSQRRWRRRKKVLKRLNQLSTKYPNAFFIKVDVDECPETAVAYNVNSMPTFIFLRNKIRWKNIPFLNSLGRLDIQPNDVNLNDAKCNDIKCRMSLLFLFWVSKRLALCFIST